MISPPPDRLDWALQQIDDGARRVGRRVDDLEIVKRRALYVHEDSEAGLDYFREHLAFYASAPGLPANNYSFGICQRD